MTGMWVRIPPRRLTACTIRYRLSHMTNDKEKGKDLTTAVDKRDWLIAKGLAKPGRGKFSNVAKEALAEAERQGVVFLNKGTAVAPVTIIENGERKQEIREINPWAHHPDPIRRDPFYTFTGTGGKKVQIAVATACLTCQYSLGWCYCETPLVRDWKTREVLRLADSF